LFSGVIFAGYAIIRKHRLSADDQRRRETIRSASQQRLCLPQSTPQNIPHFHLLATRYSPLAIRYSLFAICYLLFAARHSLQTCLQPEKNASKYQKNTKQQQGNHPATKWLGVCEEHL
jgi:hypothetical protein